MLLQLSPMNMPEYVCLNKQIFEYSLGTKYGKILNMERFKIWRRCE